MQISDVNSDSEPDDSQEEIVEVLTRRLLNDESNLVICTFLSNNDLVVGDNEGTVTVLREDVLREKKKRMKTSDFKIIETLKYERLENDSDSESGSEDQSESNVKVRQLSSSAHNLL